MAVREFDGVDDIISVSAGLLGAVANGAHSIIAVLKPTTLAVGEGFVGVQVGVSNLLTSLDDGGTGKLAAFTDTEVPDVAVNLSAATWQMVGMDKASGTTAPRFHRKALGSGVWTHASSGSTMANNATLPNRVDFGAFQGGAFASFKDVRIAMVAIFNRQLSDADYVAFEAAATTQAVFDGNGGAAPLAIWDFNQASTATAVTDLSGGGANQTGITGTTVITTDDPPAWVFGVTLATPEPALPRQKYAPAIGRGPKNKLLERRFADEEAAAPSGVDLTADTGLAAADGGTTSLAVTVAASSGAATASGGTVLAAEGLIATSGTATAGGGVVTLTSVLIASAGAAAASGGTAALTVLLSASSGAASATGGTVTLGTVAAPVLRRRVVLRGQPTTIRRERAPQARISGRRFAVDATPPSGLDASAGAATAGGGTAALTVTLTASTGAAAASGTATTPTFTVTAATGAATAGGGAVTLSVTGLAVPQRANLLLVPARPRARTHRRRPRRARVLGRRFAVDATTTTLTLDASGGTASASGGTVTLSITGGVVSVGGGFLQVLSRRKRPSRTRAPFLLASAGKRPVAGPTTLTATGGTATATGGTTGLAFTYAASAGAASAGGGTATASSGGTSAQGGTATATGGTATVRFTYTAATGAGTAGGGTVTATSTTGLFVANGTATAAGGTANVRFIYPTTAGAATAAGGTVNRVSTATTGTATAGAGAVSLRFTYPSVSGTATAAGGSVVSFVPTFGHIDGGGGITGVDDTSGLTGLVEATPALAGLIG